MVDPFFTTGNNQNNNQWSAQWSSQQTIDNLKFQQLQIQEKYKQLKALLQNEWLTKNQQEEVHEQMQKLSDLYSQNKATLASLTTSISWEKEIRVNKNINTENSKARSFSFKKFMIGCGILLLVFLWWLVVIFSSLMKDPNRLAGFWIEWCVAVNMLQIFSIVFFWLLWFIALALLLLNINRLITVKNKSKVPYFIWMIFSLAILIAAWVFLVNMLQSLSVYADECTDWWDTQLAHPHVIIKNSKFKETRLPEPEYNKLIAPINVSFDLNTTEFKNRMLKLWAQWTPRVKLACWNWQELQLWSNSSEFEWTCFYTKKGTYQPEIIIYYTDSSLSEKEIAYPIWQDISIKSEISISSNQTDISSLNSALLVWKNPVILKFDASAIFRDFNLPYNISWSPECDGIRDAKWEKKVEFEHQYQNEWVYDVCVIFTALSSDYIYTFPIRVEQWEVQDDFSVSYSVSVSSSNKAYDNPSSIEITQLPTTLTLQVVSVTPDNGSVQRKLYKDWFQIAAEFSDKNLFKIIIDEDKPQELILEIANAEKQISTQKRINITVNKQDIIWVLKASPGTVWTSPFEVKLDASTTSLKDPSDEIVFFSRDYWDWAKNPNTSASIVSHEYKYDFVNENWVYYPNVTIQTKNWLIYTISGVIINVKKPDTTLEIYLEDNPAQIASVWQNVPISISVDWMPKNIYWNFWDWETLECDWRSCAEVSHVYAMDWSYTITVKVEFEDKPMLDWKINLVVK